MNQTEASVYGGILAGSAAFRDLHPAALQQILNTGLLLDAKQGDLVLFENMRGSPGLYVVLEGEVEVFLSHGVNAENLEPKQIHLANLGPGHCFGEYSLIDGKGTSASARALTDVGLFFLPRGEFLRMIENDHLAGKIIYRNFLLLLIARLRQRHEELDVLIMQ